MKRPFSLFQHCSIIISVVLFLGCETPIQETQIIGGKQQLILTLGDLEQDCEGEGFCSAYSRRLFKGESNLQPNEVIARQEVLESGALDLFIEVRESQTERISSFIEDGILTQNTELVLPSIIVEQVYLDAGMEPPTNAIINAPCSWESGPYPECFYGVLSCGKNEFGVVSTICIELPLTN